MRSRLIVRIAGLILVSSAFAFSQVGRSGGKGERYDTDDVKTFSGTITKVDHPVATLKADDGTEYRIHMGPFWFWDDKGYSLTANAKATITGEVETLKGTNHFYPREVVQEKKTMRLADDDGVPEWAGKRGFRGQSKGYGRRGGTHRGHWARGCGRCCG